MPAITAKPAHPAVVVSPRPLTEAEYRQILIDERVEREVASRWFRR